MTLIAQGLALLTLTYTNNKPHQIALTLLKKLLLPKEITRMIIRKYIRKAINNHSWYKLRPEEKILLKLASKIVVKVKSPALKKVLENIFIKIEFASIKAQALYYGIIITLTNPLNKIKETLNNIKQLLYLGISYLNNPPWYKIYG